MVKALAAKKVSERAEKERSDNEYAPITKRELKHILQNKREVNDLMWDLDPTFDTRIIAKP